MKPSGTVSRAAAEWLVEIERGSLSAAAEARFAEWLAADPAHERELERCEAALVFARAVAADAKRLVAMDTGAPRRHRHEAAARVRATLARPAVAWGVASLSVAVAVIAVVAGFAPGNEPEASPGASLELAGAATASDSTAVRARGGADAARTAGGVAAASAPLDVALGTAYPVAVLPQTNAAGLPAGIVVDARSVAVLPFVGVRAAGGAGGDRPDIAASLYSEVVRQLAAIPGIYVVDAPAVLPYAGAGLTPEEVAAHLGVRGIVEGRVAAGQGRVQVTLTWTDAASDTSLEDDFEGPVAELASMRTDIVANIAAALAESAAPAALDPLP